MTEPEWASVDDFNAIPDHDFPPTIAEDDGPPTLPPIILETWAEFSAKADEDIPCIVDNLWPEGSLGFIASPPKKGKTWLALSLALSVATGQQFLARYTVTRPRRVLYIALEGHRGSLKTRIGCLARGMGIDPDGDIPNLDLTYKPRGINIASPAWANHVVDAADSIKAELVIVDVLRAAALIKENAQEDFAALRSNLAPLLEDGRSLAFLHHFTKLSETSKERTPAERMSGSGAMYGALDVGVFITGAENGARKLRIDYDGRDIAMPDPIGVELTGVGHGPNGGFTYTDKAWWVPTAAPDQEDLEASAADIAEWLAENDGTARPVEIAAAFDVSEKTVHRRRLKLLELGYEYHASPGKPGVFRAVQPKGTLIPQVQLDVGHEGRTDTPDTRACPTSNGSTMRVAEVGQTPRTNDGVLPSESTDLQGKMGSDTPDSLRESVLPADATDSLEPADDDIHFD